MTGGELLPEIAWEQAVYICLFIVLIVWMFAWFSKQSDKWQQLMFDIDEKWRALIVSSVKRTIALWRT